MSDLGTQPSLVRETVERHRDNRVTLIVAGAIIVVAIIAGSVLLMNRDQIDSQAASQSTAAAAQAANAQAADANTQASMANLQAQQAAANAAANAAASRTVAPPPAPASNDNTMSESSPANTADQPAPSPQSSQP